MWKYYFPIPLAIFYTRLTDHTEKYLVCVCVCVCVCACTCVRVCGDAGLVAFVRVCFNPTPPFTVPFTVSKCTAMQLEPLPWFQFDHLRCRDIFNEQWSGSFSFQHLFPILSLHLWGISRWRSWWCILFHSPAVVLQSAVIWSHSLIFNHRFNNPVIVPVVSQCLEVALVDAWRAHGRTTPAMSPDP